MEELVSKLAAFIATDILKQPKRAIRADEALISSGLIDSFSLMDISLFVEGKFGVRIEDVTIITEEGCEDITGSPKNLIIV